MTIGCHRVTIGCMLKNLDSVFMTIGCHSTTTGCFFFTFTPVCIFQRMQSVVIKRQSIAQFKILNFFIFFQLHSLLFFLFHYHYYYLFLYNIIILFLNVLSVWSTTFKCIVLSYDKFFWILTHSRISMLQGFIVLTNH